jgi:hypothetical protein
MNECQLVTIVEATELAGMRERTFRRRVASGEVATVSDPRDRRRKLVRLDDLRQYMGELPLKQAG